MAFECRLLQGFHCIEAQVAAHLIARLQLRPQRRHFLCCTTLRALLQQSVCALYRLGCEADCSFTVCWGTVGNQPCPYSAMPFFLQFGKDMEE